MRESSGGNFLKGLGSVWSILIGCVRNFSYRGGGGTPLNIIFAYVLEDSEIIYFLENIFRWRIFFPSLLEINLFLNDLKHMQYSETIIVKILMKTCQQFVKPIKIRFLFTILRLIFNQTEFRLLPNQPENGKYNLVSVDLTRL